MTSVTSKDLPKDSAPNTPPAGNSARGLADEGIRVSLQRVDRLVNMIGELVILQTVLSQQRHLVPSPLLQKTIVQLGKITKEIQDTSMGLRLVPFKPICQKLQRIVRDTSKELGKDIEFVIIGEDIEIDKTVADQLGDPLVHMVRNACDHGLEATSDRVAAGKVPRGKIVLKAGYEGDKIVIELSDDGRGLDAQRLRAKAQEKGLIKPGQSLTEAECHALIFAAGFSTKAAVTDLSGRGVGMDVVKTNVEKVLKGTVGLETKIGSGTKFRIMLPMSLAIIDAMVVRCAGERFVIPLGQVFESVRPTAKDLHKVVGVGDVMKLRGENLPLIHLGRQLGVKSDAPGADAVAVVTRDGQRATAFLVDEIIARQQVVIKKLGREVPQHRGVTGGAVLGDGVAALIVDLNELSGAKSHQKGAAA